MLLETVWKLEPAQTTNIVDVYVNYLRRKLKDPTPGHLVRTVRGKGYLVPGEKDLNPAIDLPIVTAKRISAERIVAERMNAALLPGFKVN
jgi:DNA-binding winged helix-turn-helix (wHTH) protein